VISWFSFSKKEVTIKKQNYIFCIDNLFLYVGIPIQQPRPRIPKNNNEDIICNLGEVYDQKSNDRLLDDQPIDEQPLDNQPLGDQSLGDQSLGDQVLNNKIEK
jgi:hypothetical protein